MKLSQLNFNSEVAENEINKTRQNDVAVIGISAKMPQANNVQEFWKNLVNGVDHIDLVPQSRMTDIQEVLGSKKILIDESKLINCALLDRIDFFDYKYFNISPKEAQLMDPHQRIFLQTVYEAIDDAGYGGELLDGVNTGVFVAVNGNYTSAYKTLVMNSGAMENEFFITGNIESLLASRIAFLKNLKGPTMIIDTACSSSLVCLHEACKSIQVDDCEMAIAGGINICLLPIESQHIGISSVDGKTRSFDALANGTGLGEGSIAIVLKSYKKALADSDPIYAVIKGSAVNHDGRSLSLTSPNPISQADVIEKAWRNSKIRPENISYIEAHGTATKIGDPIEIQGITEAFRRYTDRKQFCGIGSVKSNIGHLGNLSGLAGFLKMVLAIKYHKLPPTINFNYPNHEIDFHKSPIYIQDTVKEWEDSGKGRICGISSFGISGTNCHVVLSETPQIALEKCIDNKLDIFTLSAVSITSLITLIKNYIDYINNEEVNYHNFCYTVNCRRGHYIHRIAFVVNGIEDLKEKLCHIYEALLENGSIRLANVLTLAWTEEYDKESVFYLSKLQRKYISGEKINYAKYYDDIAHRSIHLPPYPFEQMRCWINPIKENAYELYQTCWIEVPKKVKYIQNINKKLLLIIRPSSFTKQLQRLLKPLYNKIVIAELSDKYKNVKNNYYMITGKREEIAEILDSKFDRGIDSIIYAAPMFEQNTENLELLKKYINVDFKLLFHISSILQERKKGKINVSIILDNVFSVQDGDINKPLHSTIFSLAKSMNIESLYEKYRCIDIDSSVSLEDIITEIESSSKEVWTALRGEKKYIEMLDFARFKEEKKKIIFRNGVYVVTGGMGQIGRHISMFLANKKQCTVVILSRSNKEQNFLSHPSIKFSNGEYRLKKNNSRIVYKQVDVSDEETLSNTLCEVRKQFGQIKGIIHCAGVVSAGKPVKGREDIQEEFFVAKVYGTWLLHKLTLHDNLDFFVLFSSFITLMGGAFSCEYAAANTYEDAMADYRNSLQLPVTVIDWTIWSDIVENNGFDYDSFLYKPIKTENAMVLWEKALLSGLKKVIIGELNVERGYIEVRSRLPFQISNQVINFYENKMKFNSEKLKNMNITLTSKEKNNIGEVETKLANVIGTLLGLQTIDIDEDLFRLGMNSIIAVKFEIEAQKMEVDIKYDDIYKNNTIHKLANLLNKKQMYDNNKIAIVHNEVKSSQQLSVMIKEPVEPFNDFFYRECYYMSLFSVYKYLNMDILIFLTNDIPVYAKDMLNGSIKVKYNSQLDIETLFLKNNIVLRYEPYQEKVFNQIAMQIDAGNPVILWVDCFYLPYIMDTYLKEHIQHTCVVYGYSRSKNIFYIVDHTSKDSLTYSKQEISFESMQQACIEFKHTFKNVDINKHFVTFTKKQVNKNINGKEIKRALYSNYRLEMLNGLEILNSFLQEFKELTNNNMSFFEYYPKILDTLNEIINVKKAEYNKIKCLMSEEIYCCNLCEKLVITWDKLRKIATKMYYSSQKCGENQKKVYQYIKDIITHEREFVDSILEIEAKNNKKEVFVDDREEN